MSPGAPAFSAHRSNPGTEVTPRSTGEELARELHVVLEEDRVVEIHLSVQSNQDGKYLARLMSSSDFDFLLVFDSLAESRARISELMYMLYPTHACGERCRSFTRVEPAPVVAEGAPFGDGPGVQDSQPPEALLPLIELLGETTSRIDQMLICRVRESRPPPHVIETLKRLMKARWQLDQAYLDLWADAEGRQVDGSGPPPRG